MYVMDVKEKKNKVEICLDFIVRKPIQNALKRLSVTSRWNAAAKQLSQDYPQIRGKTLIKIRVGKKHYRNGHIGQVFKLLFR